MPGEAKSGPAPGADEFVRLVPAVEADAEAIGLQQPVDVPECRIEPFSGAIVADGLAVARTIIAEIGRIGQDEIDGARWQAAHDVGAVAVKDGVRGHRTPPFRSCSAFVTAS